VSALLTLDVKVARSSLIREIRRRETRTVARARVSRVSFRSLE